MIEILLWIAFVAGTTAIALVLFAGACLTLSLAWAAHGEPDVNGDVERDAGLPWPPDDDLQPAAQSWDHGSGRTAARLNPQTQHPHA